VGGTVTVLEQLWLFVVMTCKWSIYPIPNPKPCQESLQPVIISQPPLLGLPIILCHTGAIAVEAR
jgi:hypothetical protein